MAVPSFPDVNVTGPVHNFVRSRWAATPEIFYLGTCEVTPQMQRRKYRAEVKNEIAGTTLPFQKTNDGEAAVISLMLTRFSKLAWGQILEAGNTFGVIPVAGTEGPFARGHPVFGAMDFELWQVYSNFFGSFPTANLEIGWYWPQVEILQHDTIKAGAQGEALLLVLDATPQWQTDGSFILYSNADSLFPADVRVPQ